MACVGCQQRKAAMRGAAPALVRQINRIPWPVWLLVGVIGFLGVIKLTLEGIGWVPKAMG